MSKIIGNPVGTTLPKSDWMQNDPTKGDYIRNKPDLQTLIGDTPVADQVNTALSSAQSYTDGKIANLLDNSTEAVDSIYELRDAMEDNADAISALETIAGNKANASDLTSHTNNKNNPHGVTLSQLGVNATAAELNIMDGVTATAAELNYVDGVTSNIQTQLDGKAAASHGTHVTWSTTTPKANGTAAVGSETKVARGDHVHPTDTSRAAASDLATLKTLVGDKAVATQINEAIANTTQVQFITWEADD